MKKLLKNIFLSSLSLFVITNLLEGVKITGGYQAYLLSGTVLSVLFTVLKPILNIVTFPLKFLTFGMISWLINIFIFYLLTTLVPQVSITSFVFPGFSIAGFVVPKIYLSAFFAYLAASFTYLCVFWFFEWLVKK